MPDSDDDGIMDTHALIRRLALALLLLVPVAARAQMVTQFPYASVPYAGTESWYCYQINGPNGGNVRCSISGIIGSLQIATVRIVVSGTTDSVGSSDGVIATVAWNSSVASAKTEILPLCAATNKSVTVTIKDAIGTAGTYVITVNPSGGNTIDAQTSDPLTANYESSTYQCNGSGNWLKE